MTAKTLNILGSLTPELNVLETSFIIKSNNLEGSWSLTYMILDIIRTNQCELAGAKDIPLR